MMKAAFIRAKLRGVTSKKEARWLAARTKEILSYLLLTAAISAIASAFGAVFVLVSKSVIDTASGTARENLPARCAALIAVVIARLVLSTLSGILINKATIKLSTGIKTRLFEAVLKKEWLRINAFHSGDLMARFSGDLDHVVSGVVRIVPELVSLATQLAASLYVLLKLDAALAGMALMLGPLAVAAGRLFSRRIRDLHAGCREADAEARSYMQESIQNMLMIKAFSGENRSISGLRKALEKHNMLRMRRHNLSILSGVGLSLGFWAGYVMSIVWGSFRLDSGHITFGTMAAFLQLAGQIQAPFLGLAKVFPQIYTTFASAGRLISVEDLPDEESAAKIPPPAELRPVFISVKNVSFSYDKEEVLSGADLEASAGELVILAGPSGSGKTTILRLLLSLIGPDEGEISIGCEDGTFLSVGTDTRKFFSYVPQGSMLFSGTIEENIRYGRPNAAFGQVVACARIACIHDFISGLPDKYRTVIGERGLGLSEGQAQRIAIARALLCDSPILLLDEATSAIDGATEAKLLENLRAHLRDRICIFVSHRQTVVDLCDRAYILKGGTLTCAETSRSKPPVRLHSALLKEDLRSPAL